MNFNLTKHSREEKIGAIDTTILLNKLGDDPCKHG